MAACQAFHSFQLVHNGGTYMHGPENPRQMSKLQTPPLEFPRQIAWRPPDGTLCISFPRRLLLSGKAYYLPRLFIGCSCRVGMCSSPMVKLFGDTPPLVSDTLLLFAALNIILAHLMSLARLCRKEPLQTLQFHRLLSQLLLRSRFSRSGAAAHNLFRFLSSPLSSSFPYLSPIGLLGLWRSFVLISKLFLACFVKDGHTRELLRGLHLRPARQILCPFLATWSSSLSRHLGVFSTASLGGLGHCGVFPDLTPPQPPNAQPETVSVAPQLWGFGGY